MSKFLSKTHGQIVSSSLTALTILMTLAGVLGSLAYSPTTVSADHAIYCDYGALRDSTKQNLVIGINATCDDPHAEYGPLENSPVIPNNSSLHPTAEDLSEGTASPAPASTSEESNGGDDEEIGEPSCESEGGEFSFGLCPLLRWTSGTVEILLDQVKDQVEINPAYYNAPAGDPNPLREVWSTLRNIAYILLIPILLVLVIGTALGFSFLDAYTVKRAMPRLLFAIVFMALSYDIGVIVIEVSNGLARGIGGMLTASVGGGDNLTLVGLFSPPTVGSGGAVGVADNLIGGAGVIVGGVVAIGALSLGVLGSFLLGAAMALIVIFFLLLMRQLVVIVLLVVLPLAILSWVFPGNDKLWKLVWGTFTKLALAGVVINAVMISGFIVAYIINGATSGASDGALDSVFIIVSKLGVIIAGLAGIPWAIKASFGAASALVGAVNDRSKGLMDRNKNWRDGKRKQVWEDTKKGERFNNTPFIGGTNSMRKLSRGIGYGVNVKQGVKNLGADPREWKSAFKSNMSNYTDTASDGAATELAKESPDFARIMGNGDFMQAAEHRNREDIIKSLVDQGYTDDEQNERTAQHILNAQQTTTVEAFNKARLAARVADGTSYNNTETGEFEVEEFLKDINTVYGSDRNGAANAIGEGKAAMARAGQLGGMASFGTMLEEADNMYRARGGANYAKVSKNAREKVMASARTLLPPSQAVTMQKPSSAVALAESYSLHVEQAVAERNNTRTALADTSLTPEARNNLLGQLASQEAEVDARMAQTKSVLDAMTHQASPDVANAFASKLMSTKLQGENVTVSAPVVDSNGQVEYYMDDNNVRQMKVTQKVIENASVRDAVEHREQQASSAANKGTTTGQAWRERRTTHGGALDPETIRRMNEGLGGDEDK